MDLCRVGDPVVVGVPRAGRDERDDVPEQASEAFGGSADETRHRTGIAAGLEEPFAEVYQVALGLELAAAPNVHLGDRDPVERILPKNGDVSGDDLSVFERKHVERARELLALEEQRHGETPLIPAPRERNARRQVVERQPLDQRDAADFCFFISRQSVGADRVEPIAEDPAEVGGQRLERCADGRGERRRGHQSIIDAMRLRTLNVGCFGGGTVLPSLLGGLKSNPWLQVNAVVTMFDSGGSSGQLRDELGVLPPGDVLKCALALARNEREARRVLLARMPTLQHERLRGHTGGNLLLSMMERYSGDFLAAVDGLRALLGCKGRVWPVSVQQATICAEYGDGSQTRREVEVDAGQNDGRAIRRLWLEPEVTLHEAAASAIPQFDAVIIGPGSFYTSLMPILLVKGAPEAVRQVKGPVILVTNLLTEGSGMSSFTAGEAVRLMGAALGRPVDVVVVNHAPPSEATLARYRDENKQPLKIGEIPASCEVVSGDFWSGDIARHDRRRLATAVWAVLARRML